MDERLEKALEFSNYMTVLNSQTEQDSAVLIDDNDTPIKVDNVNDFCDNVLDIYFTASNEYLDKYNDLKTNRTVQGILDL